MTANAESSDKIGNLLVQGKIPADVAARLRSAINVQGDAIIDLKVLMNGEDGGEVKMTGRASDLVRLLNQKQLNQQLALILERGTWSLAS